MIIEECTIQHIHIQVVKSYKINLKTKTFWYHIYQVEEEQM